MKKTVSEVGQKQLDAIEARLSQIAERLEPLYDEIDALSDEASRLVRQEAAVAGFEHEAAEGTKRPRPLRPEFAMDPFTITVRTFGRQRRLVLRSCTKAFYLFRVVPHIARALAEIGIELDADERNIVTVSRDRWEERVSTAFSGGGQPTE